MRESWVYSLKSARENQACLILIGKTINPRLDPYGRVINFNTKKYFLCSPRAFYIYGWPKSYLKFGLGYGVILHPSGFPLKRIPQCPSHESRIPEGLRVAETKWILNADPSLVPVFVLGQYTNPSTWLRLLPGTTLTECYQMGATVGIQLVEWCLRVHEARRSFKA